MKQESDFNIKSFAVIGAGPSGCIVSAVLAGGGYEVTLCDLLPELLEPAVKHGITLEGEIDSMRTSDLALQTAARLRHTVTRTCEDISELAQYKPEVIIVCVKTNAISNVAKDIKEIHDAGTYVVSWQNGIDTEFGLAEFLGAEWTMRAVANYGGGLLEPGRTAVFFHHPPHFIQEMVPEARQAAVAVCQALTKSGLHTEHTDDIISKVWRKAVMNACMNPVCAVTGMTMKQALDNPLARELIENIAKECINIARANEIFLGWDYFDYCMKYICSAGDHKPSMLMDIESGRKTEIDFINGKMIEYGKRVNMETPYNSTITGLLKAIETK